MGRTAQGPVVSKGIDPPIRPLVRLLRKHGVTTLSSCQGGRHSDHATILPTVTCAATKTSMREVGELIASTLIDAGWSGFTRWSATIFRF